MESSWDSAFAPDPSFDDAGADGGNTSTGAVSGEPVGLWNSGGGESVTSPVEPAAVASSSTSAWDDAFLDIQAEDSATSRVLECSLPPEPFKRTRGRPKGSIGTSSQRRQWAQRPESALRANQSEDRSAPPLSGIEHARAVKAAKHAEKKQEQLQLSVAPSRDATPLPLTLLSAQSKLWAAMLALAASPETNGIQRVSLQGTFVAPNFSAIHSKIPTDF